jgi:hypothetical protein
VATLDNVKLLLDNVKLLLDNVKLLSDNVESPLNNVESMLDNIMCKSMLKHTIALLDCFKILTGHIKACNFRLCEISTGTHTFNHSVSQCKISVGQ